MTEQTFYSCPECHARHSTEAWTYKTRKEYGYDDIDSEDIIHMNEIDKLLNSTNEFFCPTCSHKTLAKTIYNFEIQVITKIKIKVEKLLLDIKKNNSCTTLKGKKGNELANYHISFDTKENEWLIGLEDDEHVDGFTDVQKAVDDLLRDGISVGVNRFISDKTLMILLNREIQ